jgi:TRAP-type C4-dicarboxylate transport system permease small subunit
VGAGASPPAPTEDVEGGSVLDTWERFNRRLSGWFEWIGLVGLLVMMVVTCIDVVGAKVFRSPLMGSIDIVQLAQTVAIAFAASMALILGRHIRVEFFIRLLPRRVGAVVNSFILLLGLGLFMVILWRLFLFAHLLQTSGDYSATIYIPYYPFAYGIAFACIPVCLVFLLEFLKSLTKKRLQK